MRLWNGPTSWGDSSIPQPSLSGRRVALPQGRGLGGGSSMNGMAWFHGHPADYDGWRAGGEPEWAWRDVQPAFRAVERSELADGEWHGSDGPMRMARTRDVSALPLGFVAAGAELGLPVVEDFNGAEREGIGLLQADIDDGRRHSVVNGYLLPTLDRSNLTVRAGTLVTSIVIKEAEPLPYCASTRMESVGRVDAWRAIVLAAGALRTPQLLMLSGIGPAGHLRQHGLEVVRDLPAVGAGLQDHPLVTTTWPVIDGSPLRSARGPGGQPRGRAFGRRQRPLGNKPSFRWPAPDPPYGHFSVPNGCRIRITLYGRYAYFPPRSGMVAAALINGCTGASLRWRRNRFADAAGRARLPDPEQGLND